MEKILPTLCQLTLENVNDSRDANRGDGAHYVLHLSPKPQLWATCTGICEQWEVKSTGEIIIPSKIGSERWWVYFQASSSMVFMISPYHTVVYCYFSNCLHLLLVQVEVAIRTRCPCPSTEQVQFHRDTQTRAVPLLQLQRGRVILVYA